jgi:PAS domain-containing protein
MAQKEIEIILARQLSSHLTMPVFIVGPEGTLLFYNEPAEKILGQRYDETGEMPAEKWSTAFSPSNVGGSPLPREELPLMIALNQRRPAHKRIQIQGLDGVSRNIEVTAFPLAGQADRFLGAIAIFWEVKQ